MSNQHKTFQIKNRQVKTIKQDSPLKNKRKTMNNAK